MYGAVPSQPGVPVLRRTPPVKVEKPWAPITSRRVPQEPQPRRQRALPRLPAEMPEWAQDPPAPLTLARHGLEKVRASEEGAARGIAIAVGAYAAWWVASTPHTAALLWLTAVAYGVGVVWACQAGQQPWRWTERPAKAVTAALALAGAGLLLTGHSTLTSVMAVAAAQAFAHRPPYPQPASQAWHSHNRLAGALVTAGILKRPEPGALPTILFRGKRQRTPHGESVKVELPPGTVVDDVIRRQDRLASDLGFPPRRLWLDHDPKDPAGYVTIGVAHEHGDSVTASPLADATRTDWREPVRIGTDVRGRPVLLRTAGTNDLIGGIPNSGKTSTVRIQLAHYALDPTATLYGVDGKGSRKDYAAFRPLCRRWVWGTDDDAAQQVLDLLREVLAVVQSRNVQSDCEPDGGWPGVLVLLEELQEIRSAASADQLRALDDLLGRCIRLGRAVSVKIVVSTQRPTVSDVPSGVRNLVAQQLCLKVRGVEDARIVLGSTPTLPLPARAGEGFVSTDDGQAAVDLDYLDLPTFAALCQRAASLRSAPEPTAEPTVTPTDPFAGAVHGLLALGPMQASALREMLPESIRPKDAQALGFALRSVPGVERCRLQPGSVRGYKLTETLTATPSNPAGNPAPAGSDGPIHAQQTPDGAGLSGAKALP
jgi:hypothetical protein